MTITLENARKIDRGVRDLDRLDLVLKRLFNDGAISLAMVEVQIMLTAEGGDPLHDIVISEVRAKREQLATELTALGVEVPPPPPPPPQPPAAPEAEAA